MPNYTSLSESPDHLSINGANLTLEAVIFSNNSGAEGVEEYPDMQMIRLVTDDESQRMDQFTELTSLYILADGVAYKPKYTSDHILPRGRTILFIRAVLNTPISALNISDLVIGLKDRLGTTRYIRAGTEHTERRGLNEYVEYSNGMLDGFVSVPNAIKSHKLIPAITLVQNSMR